MAKILIVDDLSANRTVLATLLRREGHAVSESADGHAGLAAARAEPPDLVITDVLMPVMDGYELTRQLRLDPVTRRIPTVFYTAYYGGREARARAKSLGVSEILSKPVETKEVLRVVERALAGRAPAPVPVSTVERTSPSDREHLRLLTDEFSDQGGDLRVANARLRALINIGLELASERDPDRLLQSVCAAARDLFAATYVTLGIVDLDSRTVRRFAASGEDGTNWIKAGDPISGIFDTVVTERRTIRGATRGDRVADWQLPALHPAVQAFVVAPVASPANVYGWFCLVGNEGRSFTDEEEDLVTALSGQVGRIYENSHFRAVAQERAAALEHEVLEREEAEAALRRERDRAQQFLDMADVIVLALDVDGRITLVNRGACSVLGWTRDELMGGDWIEMCLPARIRPEFREKFKRLISGGLPVGENVILSRTGEERLISWRNTLLRDAAGQVTGTLSSGADITERQQSIDALRTAEERMRFALEASGVGIWDMNFATGVLQWSDILEAQYGLSPGSFGGTYDAFVNCVHHEDRDALRATVAFANRSGIDFSMQHRAQWPDGSMHWLSGSGRILLGEDGHPVRGVGISQDVTERLALEKQYRQSQKMDAVGQLASGVAHDFNNLMTVVLSYAELMSADEAISAEHGKFLDEIINAAQSATRLTGQLLAFGRQQVLNAAPLDVNALIAKMADMLGRLIGNHVDVSLALAPGLPLAYADRSQMEQVIMNLVVNARDAMPDGGGVSIETADVELDGFSLHEETVAPGRYVMIAVTDTGSGMSEETRRRLFEPFFTTKEVGRGTGLGLSTTYGIVKQSKGYIRVYSELGRGTTFKVYLPEATPDQLESPSGPRKRAQVDLPTETLLLVEDEPAVRRLARRVLAEAGYRVLEAANGDDAEKMFGDYADAIRLVVTDVTMPGCGGPELLKRLRLRAPGLKAMFMSGFTSESALSQTGMERGVSFVQKPFTTAELLRGVREALHGG